MNDKVLASETVLSGIDGNERKTTATLSYILPEAQAAAKTLFMARAAFAAGGTNIHYLEKKLGL